MTKLTNQLWETQKDFARKAAAETNPVLKQRWAGISVGMHDVLATLAPTQGDVSEAGELAGIATDIREHPDDPEFVKDLATQLADRLEQAAALKGEKT